MINKHTIILYCRGPCCIHDTFYIQVCFEYIPMVSVIHNLIFPTFIFWVMVTWVSDSIQSMRGPGGPAPLGGAEGGGQSRPQQKNWRKKKFKKFLKFFHQHFFFKSKKTFFLKSSETYQKMFSLISNENFFLVIFLTF